MELLNIDCLDYMKKQPDKSFDLAIVDPPYGLGDRLVKGGCKGKMGTLRNLADDKVVKWDSAIPSFDYFFELKRVSKKQIVWGANYFLDYLGKTDGFIVWDKMNGTNPLADAEVAWQNIKSATRMFRHHHFSGGGEKKIHPTQKPVALYRWLLENYAIKDQVVLDTHLGSGSIAIAAHYFGIDFIGCEIDKDYYNKACIRVKEETRQLKLF